MGRNPRPRMEIPPELAAGRREWLGLLVLGLANLVLSLDLSILYLALPTISASLGASQVEALWMIDIYGFVIAGLLITMGSLGDRIGRRKLLMIGAVIFAVGSVAAAMSTSVAMLIGARAAMGVGAATVMPSGMAIIATMFRHPAQRGMAISTWMSTFMLGMIIGPPLGGLLLRLFPWGSVFLLGVPVAVLLLVVGPRLLPEQRTPGSRAMDVPSVLLALTSVLAIAFSVKELAANGTDGTRIAIGVTGVALAGLFVLRQRRLEQPIIDLKLFAIPAFVLSLFLGLMGGAVQGGSSYLINVFVQLVHDRTPLQASLVLLPALAAMIVGLMLGPGIASRVPPGRVIAFGLPIAAVGYVVITQIGPDTGLPVLVAGYATVLFGVGIPMGLGTAIGLGAVGPQRAAAASSLTQTANELGVAFGIAGLGSIGHLVYRTQLAAQAPPGVPDDALAGAQSGIEAGIETAAGLPAPLDEQFRAVVDTAFTDGLNIVAVTATVIMICLAVAAGIMLRNLAPLPPPGQPPAGAEAGAGAVGRGADDAGAPQGGDSVPDAAALPADAGK
ncbi:MFS transporter [Myceligenerans indicum]|uniref:MFS transporter n=1 Tax=Myceligenerans indicum TaxID=2593663 RepID=A0ABS1LHL6_9MICO|nr:MFS transporter [Myceligenerans indicum]MBL0885628.1 MFS transporter [Myceligenerans indicum]